MKSKPTADEKWFTKHFPNKQAREAADLVIDELNVNFSMSSFIDVWIAAYVKAGGQTTFVR